MSSSRRMEQVFFHAHIRSSNYVLRHTTHGVRYVMEHLALGLAVCSFCVVIITHRTFIHRQDIASIISVDSSSSSISSSSTYCSGDDVDTMNDITLSSSCDAAAADSSRWRKKIPISCLRSIPGFRDDADVNHILLHYALHHDNDTTTTAATTATTNHDYYEKEQAGGINNSSAFTIHRGRENEQIVSGMMLLLSPMMTNDESSNNIVDGEGKLYSSTCSIGSGGDNNSNTNTDSIIMNLKQKSNVRMGHGWEGGRTSSSLLTSALTTTVKECSQEMTTFLAQRGYLYVRNNANDDQPLLLQEEEEEEKLSSASPIILTQHQRHQQQQQYSPIVYSYSHTQGLLRLQPSLQHTHNISTQFIIVSPTDVNCFGEPFTQNIIFRLIGPDTVILNWILGLQSFFSSHLSTTTTTTTTTTTIHQRPRFVYHWKTRKESDLDVFDMDHYAFSSKSLNRQTDTTTTTSTMLYQAVSPSLPVATMNMLLPSWVGQQYPLYRFIRFLSFKLLVLLSTLLIFFLTTSLVSFTFQETQDRMLEFTLQLQLRVRAGLPLGTLIFDHVLENLVFVPIMVGMIFFLIEFYGGDKFLAFMVLSMVWVCEVFSAICVRSVQGMHFFPRVFFLYFTLFHVYFFSCPVGVSFHHMCPSITPLFFDVLQGFLILTFVAYADTVALVYICIPSVNNIILVPYHALLLEPI